MAVSRFKRPLAGRQRFGLAVVAAIGLACAAGISHPDAPKAVAEEAHADSSAKVAETHDEICQWYFHDQDVLDLERVSRHDLSWNEKQLLAGLVACRHEFAQRRENESYERQLAEKEAAEVARIAAAKRRAQGFGPREIPLCVGSCR